MLIFFFVSIRNFRYNWLRLGSGVRLRSWLRIWLWIGFLRRVRVVDIKVKDALEFSPFSFAANFFRARLKDGVPGRIDNVSIHN